MVIDWIMVISDYSTIVNSYYGYGYGDVLKSYFGFGYELTFICLRGVGFNHQPDFVLVDFRQNPDS